MDAITVSLPFVAPYDYGSLLAFLAARAIPGVERVDGARYARTFARSGTCGTLEIEPATSDRETRELVLTVRLTTAGDVSSLARGKTAREHAEVAAALGTSARRVFDLDADGARIGAHLARDPALAPLVAARPGLRVPGAWDGFELAVRAVLGQQVSVLAATGLAGKLVALFGEPLPFASPPPAPASGLTHLFPTPARLAAADLSVLPMPRARSSALGSLARAVAERPGLLAPAASLAEAVARLRSLPGIGEWTAQYIAMRQLREPDAFPAADVALQRALADAHGARPSARELLARAAAWSPYRAYAALHLWASLASGATRKLPAPGTRR